MSGKRAKQIRKAAGRFANSLAVEAYPRGGGVDQIRFAHSHYYAYIRTAKSILRHGLTAEERKVFWHSVNNVTLLTRQD